MEVKYPTGWIYQRKKSRYWWAKIVPYKGAKPIYESTQRTRKDYAETWLKNRLKDFGFDLGHVKPEKVTFDELADDLRADYKIRGMKCPDRLEYSIKHLKPMFSGMLAIEINTARVNHYINRRMEEGAANGTINRELAALHKMLTVGARSTPPKVVNVIHIPKLKESSPRKGFLEHGEYLAILEKLPDYCQGPVTFGYKTGWRQAEILGLTWANVDLKAGTVTLDQGTTKNDAGRIVYMDDELKTLLEREWRSRKSERKLTPFVFPNKERTGRIKREHFHRVWKKACGDAGHPGKLFHDLRRTAARNMVRAGIPERVAMQITGHKTRAIFDRYNIVNDTDLKEAARKIAGYHQAAENAAQVTPQVTPHQKLERAGS